MSIKIFLPSPLGSFNAKPIETLNTLFDLEQELNYPTDERTLQQLKENDFSFASNVKAPFLRSDNKELTLPVLVDGGVKLWGVVPILQYLSNKFEILDGRPSLSKPNDPSGAQKLAIAQAALDLYSSRVVTVEGNAVRQNLDVKPDFDSLLDSAAASVQIASNKLNLIGGDDLTIADLLFRVANIPSPKFSTLYLEDLKGKADAANSKKK